MGKKQEEEKEKGNTPRNPLRGKEWKKRRE